MTFKIFVAGHRGMVGSAIVRHLVSRGHPENLIVTRDREQLDLVNQAAVQAFLAEERPEQIYFAAAKVGGILANNTYPADFIYKNLMMQANVIDAAFRCGVRKILFLGSSCIYPKLAKQPISERSLLNGFLEPTNEPYAVAKIAGIKLCESYNRQYGDSHGVDYRSVMPTNLYGPGDNYHQENSHVIPALIRRFSEAKAANAPSVAIWGTGAARREFLYVDDMAEACFFIMNLKKSIYDQYTLPMSSHINVGSGEEISIAQLAKVVARVVGYQGDIVAEPAKPDGAPRKLLNSSRINAMGWTARVSLEDGLEKAYRDFLQRYSTQPQG